VSRRTIIAEEPGDWAEAYTPDVLETAPLGPCIGAMVYDHQTSHGLVSHINQGDGVHADFAAALQNTIADPSQLVGWVRGGEWLPESGDAPNCAQNRQRVVDELAALGIVQLDIEWIETQMQEAVTMVLDCETGRFSTEVDTNPAHEQDTYDTYDAYGGGYDDTGDDTYY
jgi:hypothetical protein